MKRAKIQIFYILARWNLLQASWGIGKAFYAQNQPGLPLNNENPLCRFKAIGYSAIPKSSTDTDCLSLIIKKKPSEVESLKTNLVNDLQAALGKNFWIFGNFSFSDGFLLI